MKEYIIEAFLRDAKTNEVLCKISGHSMESFEEELGKFENIIKNNEKVEECYCSKCGEPLQCQHKEEADHEGSICGKCAG